MKPSLLMCTVFTTGAHSGTCSDVSYSLLKEVTGFIKAAFTD